MPLIASAAIGVGGSLLSGLFGSSSAKKAADKAAKTGQAVGLGLQNLAQSGLDAQTNILQPYLDAGGQGVRDLSAAYAPGGALSDKFSFDPSQIANNPNYQFVLQQGTDAVQKSAAAKGGLFSGGTLKAIDQYSQGLATNTINDAYSQALNTFQTNHNNTFQGLSALTGIGMNAENAYQGAIGQRLNANVAAGNAYTGAGNAQAAGTVGAGNAWQNALAGVTGNVQAAVNPYFGGGSTAPVSFPYPQQASQIPALPTPLAPPVMPVPTSNWGGY